MTRTERLFELAAVVEILPIGPAEASRYLAAPTTLRGRWQSILDHTDPAELLTLPDRPTVERELIAAYSTAVHRTDVAPSPRPGIRPLRGYTPAQAHRWLTCVAYHAYQSGVREFLWWQLDPGILVARPRGFLVRSPKR